MNTETPWALVDQLKALTTALESWLREETGDKPVQEPEVISAPDLIAVFNDVFHALTTASKVLNELADRKGHTVTTFLAGRATGAAYVCDKSAAALRRAGEL